MYQKCKHILFRTFESVVGQCAFYGVPKSRFEAFNNRFWISYPLEVRKRLRTAENGLKSNVLTDHHNIHNKNLSVSQDKQSDTGFDPPLSPQFVRASSKCTTPCAVLLCLYV